MVCVRRGIGAVGAVALAGGLLAACGGPSPSPLRSAARSLLARPNLEMTLSATSRPAGNAPPASLTLTLDVTDTGGRPLAKARTSQVAIAADLVFDGSQLVEAREVSGREYVRIASGLGGLLGGTVANPATGGWLELPAPNPSERTKSGGGEDRPAARRLDRAIQAELPELGRVQDHNGVIRLTTTGRRVMTYVLDVVAAAHLPEGSLLRRLSGTAVAGALAKSTVVFVARVPHGELLSVSVQGRTPDGEVSLGLRVAHAPVTVRAPSHATPVSSLGGLFSGGLGFSGLSPSSSLPSSVA